MEIITITYIIVNYNIVNRKVNHCLSRLLNLRSERMWKWIPDCRQLNSAAFSTVVIWTCRCEDTRVSKLASNIPFSNILFSLVRIVFFLPSLQCFNNFLHLLIYHFYFFNISKSVWFSSHTFTTAFEIDLLIFTYSTIFIISSSFKISFFLKIFKCLSIFVQIIC